MPDDPLQRAIATLGGFIDALTTLTNAPYDLETDAWETWGTAARWNPQHGWHQP